MTTVTVDSTVTVTEVVTVNVKVIETASTCVHLILSTEVMSFT